jgi:serine protease inhibitor
LLIANEIFVKEGLAIKPAYLKVLKQSFGAAGQNVNFLDDQAATGLINNWLAEHTKDKITDIVAPGAKLDCHAGFAGTKNYNSLIFRLF